MKGELEKDIARNETRLTTMTEIQARRGGSNYHSGSGNGDANMERRDLEGEFKHGKTDGLKAMRRTRLDLWSQLFFVF